MSSPTSVTCRVSWGDMDAFEHVNNTVFLRWFEDARIEWLEAVGFPDEPGVRGPVVRAASIVFEKAVTFPDEVTVRVRATRIGETSVTLAYQIFSKKERERARSSEAPDGSLDQASLVATGDTRVVLVDRARGAAVSLPDEVRAGILAHDPGAQAASPGAPGVPGAGGR